jgi:hypothetical protein
MLGMGKLSSRVSPAWLAAFLAGALLAVWVGGGRAPPGGTLDGWDVPRLAAYLNRQGLGLHMVSASKDGANQQAAFLTTTGKGWEDFNRLTKDPGQVHRWQGTLYCEWGSWGHEGSILGFPPPEDCWIIGPFLFFGDRELLARVRAALTEFVPHDPDSPPPRPGSRGGSGQ